VGDPFAEPTEEVRSSHLSLAVVCTNFGPYHVARARGLQSVQDVSALFIELASSERLYPWSSPKRDLNDSLITLSQRPLEETRPDTLIDGLGRTLDRFRPDVVAIAGYSERAMRAAARWARRHGAGVVLMSETTRWDRSRLWWKELVKRRWVRRYVDAGFVGGSPHREYLASLAQDGLPIWSGYDCIDNTFFESRADSARNNESAARKELGLPEDYFLFVGRFAPEKNVETLLQAHAIYRRRSPSGPPLVLVGDGPERWRLRRLASELGVGDVVWAGFLRYEQLPIYYGLARCLILPSLREPWGLVANEAAASKLPLLLSTVCGCAGDLLEEGVNGFTCHPRDVQRWADLLSRMARLSSWELGSMGGASFERVRALHPLSWGRNLAEAASAAAAASAAKNRP
jgi:1,2-diacylglycerol 3-alpha-glucosyltransferase